ncbi:PH domain-containing protein [Candidatus Woesearchaeota archaeon]|nr:PH domain-containing protein [Candidatus Woesearchaeota archaeon]
MADITGSLEETPEKIILKVKQSRKGISLNYFVILILLVLGIYSLFKNTKTMELFSKIFFAVVIIVLVYSEIRIHYKKLVISNKRAILKEGILKKHEATISYPSITEVVSQQSFLERLFNYGHLIIRTSGAKKDYEIVIDKVSRPAKIKETIEGFMFRKP